MKKIVTLLSALVMWTAALAQDDLTLAYSYYNNKEYDKASYLFEDLFAKTKSRSYFNYYINCLMYTEQYDKAEKAAKKQASSAKYDPCYRIILGSVYKQRQQHDKAYSEYDAAIEAMRADRNSIIQVTNQFINIRETEYAEKALFKGRELTGEDFNTELFSVYANSRNFKMMATTGLDIVEADATQMFSVENMFQFYINNDINDEFYDILRKTLLQRIQQHPSTQLSEMMIWLLVQKKNFKSAIVQAKALDKRLNESGQRLIAIGDHALQSKDYAAAADAFKYVLAKGKDCPFHQRATFGALTSMYEQVDKGMVTDIDNIKELEAQYAATFGEFGYNSKTVPEIKNYARIEAFHLEKPDTARSIIQRALSAQGVNYSVKAALNLLLGDIQLYQGDVWDALMTYAKVESDNKQNEFGDEAKFRKARVAYYTGNFKWAASQLDVLKAATTKLVANDAMELSLLISDNAERENSVAGDTTALIAEDMTSSLDLRIYARADMYRLQNLLDRASQSLDSIIQYHKTSPLVDEAYFMKAQIELRRHNYDSAAAYFKAVADGYSYDILADKACYNYARLAETHLTDFVSAKEYYMRILTDYPGSVYAVEARERYRALEGI